MLQDSHADKSALPLSLATIKLRREWGSFALYCSQDINREPDFLVTLLWPVARNGGDGGWPVDRFSAMPIFGQTDGDWRRLLCFSSAGDRKRRGYDCSDVPAGREA